MRLAYRIFLLVLITVSVSALANFLLTQYQGKKLYEDSEKILAFTLIRSLRDTLVQDVIDGNKLRVTKQITSIKEHDNPIEYIYITDSEHRIFAHSFERGFPRYLLLNKYKHRHDGIELSARYNTTHGLIHEYSEPLVDGLGIVLHIGINQSEITAALAKNNQLIFLVSLFITFSAVLIAYFWSKQITTPLSKFADQIEHYGRGKTVDFTEAAHSSVEVQQLALTLQSAVEERQQALITLQEREENLKITLDSIGDAVITTDADGNITRMNPVAIDLTGWSLEEAKGLSVKTIFPIVNATTRQVIENPVEKVLASGETVYLSNHTTLISRDGSEYQIADSAAPIRNADDCVVGMVLVFNDVTEQYRLRQAVIDSEKKYQTLASIAPVGMFYTDANGECLYVNDKWCEITGISSDKALGDGWVKGLHPDDLDKVFTEWTRAAKEEIPFVLEYRFKQQDKVSWVLGQAHAEIGDNGELHGYVGTITDITQRKEAEISAIKSAEALAEAQSLAHIGSWELDLVADQLTWSDEIFHIFDLDPETFTPSYEDFVNAIHPDDRDKVNAAYMESLKSKQPYNIDHRLRMPDGKVKHVREQCKSFYNEKGKPIRSKGTIQDITEQASVDEILRRTQKMDALGKLTGGIAHDYNNMLGVVLGYADLLKNQLSDRPELHDYIDQIIHAGDRGAKLTSKLLSFSRQKITDAEVIDINKVLLAEKHMLEKTLTARIQLIFDLDSELWPVWLDSSYLEDVIVNLCINASHAIENNGKLSIKTSNIHLNESDAHILQLQAGDYVLISFTDTGCGMDEQTKEKIFEPFFTTKGDKGTGLGLSQVYGFIESNHGAIKVYSEVGHGSKFSIYFPKYSDKTDTIEIESKIINIDLSGQESILIVDDEPALLKLTCELLEKQGYTVFKASNGKEALKVIERESIDLLLSDVIMPEMDGYELSAIVKEKHPQIIVQLASGFSDSRHIDMVDEVLHRNLLQKPYSSQILLKRLRELLSDNSI
ncbi:MAG TPA: PAS domain S-box protein [Gammaproteobacteria bacterium]|nr:PAS domain S-box protein [Gammaproteobacteria bacterium]